MPLFAATLSAMSIVGGHTVDVRYSLLATVAELFESLTLKMKVKDVDDLDENLPANIPCQHAYVCKNWRI